MNDMLRISSFRDQWLEDFFHFATPHRKIPWVLAGVLERKLDMINAAMDYRDLLWPPGNRYEELAPPLKGFSSIRVNDQYRLIFTGVKVRHMAYFWILTVTETIDNDRHYRCNVNEGRLEGKSYGCDNT